MLIEELFERENIPVKAISPTEWSWIIVDQFRREYNVELKLFDKRLRIEIVIGQASEKELAALRFTNNANKTIVFGRCIAENETIKIRDFIELNEHTNLTREILNRAQSAALVAHRAEELAK